MKFGNLLGTLLKHVAKKNEEDIQVKTADPVVFEEVQRKFETVDEAETQERSREDVYKDFLEKIKEAQVENEASQEVETADQSVYDQMRAEIEKLKEQVNQQNSNTDVYAGSPAANEAPPVMGAQAMTNSMGGSLQIRQTPDMGAQVSHVRIPDNTLIRVMGYSENSIILDGKKSRFAQIEFNGQSGWVLESYLNFN